MFRLINARSKKKIIISVCLIFMILGGDRCFSSQSNTYGLSVDGSGNLVYKGQEFRGFGINFFDLLVEPMRNPADRSYREQLAKLGEYKIPFVRFMGGAYWASEWELYVNNKPLFFEIYDEIVQIAEENNVGLIPCFFWDFWAVPDLVGESCNSWQDENSQTVQWAKNYIQEVVTRYNDSPAIWGWELGNEWNIEASYNRLPPVAVSCGTPASRTDNDRIDKNIMRQVFQMFASEIRKYDSYRMIDSGNTFHLPYGSSMDMADVPDPMNVISVHYWPFADGTDVYDVRNMVATAKASGKPLFIGEFGVPEWVENTRENFEQMLAILENEGVQMASMWVYEYGPQDGSDNITPTNDRAYMLDLLKDLNKRVGTTYDPCGDWGYLKTDFNKDCKVNLADFEILAEQWMDCTMPDNPSCVEIIE